MNTRTIQTVARFNSEFMLPGFEGPQPAGDYRVDHDEELIEDLPGLHGAEFGAFLHLPAIGVDSRTREMVPVKSADLDAALEEDRKQS